MTDDEMGELRALRALARAVRSYLKTFDAAGALDISGPGTVGGFLAEAAACDARMEQMRAALAKAEGRS